MSISNDPESLDDLDQQWGESEMLNVRKNLKKNAQMMLGKKLRATMCVGSSDLVQETLMVTVMNLSNVMGRPKRAVYHWMISVMRHRVLKYARAGKIRERERARVAQLITVQDFSLETDLINAELKQLVMNKLEHMDDLSRRMFKLRYFEDRQLQEIADEVGLTKDAVRGNLYRTLVKIKQDLKESMS
jgi:RNA polymerase sigma-70 factor (ECF subfamily)